MKRRLLKITCVFFDEKAGFVPKASLFNECKWFESWWGGEKKNVCNIIQSIYFCLKISSSCFMIPVTKSVAFERINVKVCMKAIWIAEILVYWKHCPSCLSRVDILFNFTTPWDRLCRLGMTHFRKFTTMLFWNMRIINIIPCPKIKPNNEWL